MITPKSILIVDDEPNIRKVLKDVLGKVKTYDITVACNGQEALDFLRSKSFDWDLVLTDMMMPRMNGYELIKALHQEAPQIVTIILTAHKKDANVIKCLELGSFDYLLKPISVEKLITTVRRAFERKARFVGKPSEIVVKREMNGWVELTAPTDFEYIERFQKFTALLGNIPLTAEAREDIRVVFDELGQNAIEWGNREDRSKKITLSYCIFNDRIVFKIEDEGEGFAPEELRDPSIDPLQHILMRMEEGKRAGGYGVFISKRMMDEVVFNEKGNIVVLTKFFSKPEA